MSDHRPTRPIALPTPEELAEFDQPPASAPRSPYPYPNRLLRLNRALRSTADLFGNMDERASPSSDHGAQEPTRSRRRQFSLLDDNDELPPHLQYSSEFLASIRGMREPQRASHTRSPMTATADRSDRQISDRPVKRMRYEQYNPVSFARPPILYGHHGQVEPGHLKMELISCDGGEMVDHRSPQMYLGYQNVLKTDKSVYCSSTETTSMVMRHADTTPFCLDKLHIIAPENGFDAPVNHGVVLVAMSLEDLKPYQDTPRHAQLSDKNPAREARHRRIQRLRDMHAGNQLSLSEALRDPEIAAFYYDQATSPNATPADHSSTRYNSDLDQALAYTNATRTSRWDDRDTNSTPLMPDNAATTHSYDDILAQDDSPPAILEYRSHRQHTRSRQRAGLFAGEPYYPLMAALGGRSADDQGRQADRSAHDSQRQDSNAEQEDKLFSGKVRFPFLDPKVTFTTFRMEDGKSRVSIKFEPQVSGRFILLKLSSAVGRGNVDIQSIVVSGFAGPRFFPAREPR